MRSGSGDISTVLRSSQIIGSARDWCSPFRQWLLQIGLRHIWGFVADDKHNTVAIISSITSIVKSLTTIYYYLGRSDNNEADNDIVVLFSGPNDLNAEEPMTSETMTSVNADMG
ncbi:hypothetical protein J6590_003839 [Homalodisca vitripennis]|nr:hypothetical protein J6590_003839 [Homalodisca vitripennis]